MSSDLRGKNLITTYRTSINVLNVTPRLRSEDLSTSVLFLFAANLRILALLSIRPPSKRRNRGDDGHGAHKVLIRGGRICEARDEERRRDIQGANCSEFATMEFTPLQHLFQNRWAKCS
jgi:hypothetical protein